MQESITQPSVETKVFDFFSDSFPEKAENLKNDQKIKI